MHFLWNGNAKKYLLPLKNVKIWLKVRIAMKIFRKNNQNYSFNKEKKKLLENISVKMFKSALEYKKHLSCSPEMP